MADLPGNLQVVCRTFAYVSMAYRSFLWVLFSWHVVFSCCERALLTCIPSVSVGSGCPVTPGTPVAPGAGAGPAADLSPSPDPPAGPNRPGQPAQPPHSHGELCNTIWSSIHTRGGRKQSSWYVTPAHTCTFSRTANLKISCGKSIEEILNLLLLPWFRYSDQGGARLWRVAAERRFHAEPQRPEQPACSDGRRGHGDAEWGGQEATQSSLHLPQLQRVWRKVGFRENKKKKSTLQIQKYEEVEVLSSHLLKWRKKN